MKNFLFRGSRPWLWLPSQLAHDLAPWALPIAASLSHISNRNYRPLKWRDLTFANPLGLAGGVDKSGQCLPSWEKLGAGFLEVGTVTPKAQGPNPGTIMMRDIAHQALWNKMGFPNQGCETLLKNLNSQSRSVPLFVNVGKNRWTENNQAHLDYAYCVRSLKDHADAFVINLSSPNTEGLRDLLGESELQSFLTQLRESCEGHDGGKPFLLKLSPDMNSDTLTMAIEVSLPMVDGWILTNTTKQRASGLNFPMESGGVSGSPVRELSRKALEVAVKQRGQRREKLIVSTGGIGSADEVRLRLELGADLVQLYSALVFQGPFLFSKILKELQIFEPVSSSAHDIP